MKAILSLLVVGVAFYGFVWYDTGENPINKFSTDGGPLKHIDSAEKAADLYGSSLDKRLEAEFGDTY